MPPPRPARSRASLASAVGSVVLFSLLVAVGERGCRSTLAELFLPSGRAAWIWAQGATESGQPIAFYAMRDFELRDAVPASAELRIAADEEYLVTINGMRVGSARGDSRPRLDRYEVRELLQVGLNRLVVEARSSWGAGGLLVALAYDGRQPELVSDDSWRIYRVHRLGLVRGEWPLSGGEVPQVWSVPPTGRWRIRQPSSVVRRVSPEPPRPRVLQARRVTRLPQAPDRQPTLVFDFGREVVGTLRFELGGAGPPGRLWVSTSPLTLYDQLPVARVMSVPGRGSWQDSVPRKFRYASLSGVLRVEQAQLLQLASDSPYTVPPLGGLLGLRPPYPRGGWMQPSPRLDP